MNKEKADNSKNRKKSKGIFKGISTLLGWGIISIIIIFIVLLILLQFRVFRNFVIEKGLSIANIYLIAKIELDDLHFNPFGSINLYGLRILTDGDTLINAKEILLDVDFWKLTENHLLVRKFLIKSPHIKFIRNPIDSLWNFEKIAPPSEDTTEAETPQWVFEIKNFKIKNGNFTLRDPLDNNEYKSKINYSLLNIEELNLELSTGLNFIDENYNVKVQELSFTESHSNFKLDKMKFVASAAKNELQIDNFFVELGDCWLSLDLSAKQFELFSPDIERFKFNLDLELNQFDFDIFDNFFEFDIDLPPIDKFTLNASGMLNEIVVKNLNCEIGNSAIQLNGVTKNLLNIDDFLYEINSAQIVLYKNQIDKLKKLIGDFPDINRIRFLGGISGGLEEISSNFILTSDIGSLQGKIGIQGFHDRMIYSGNLVLNSLNLEPLLSDNLFNSSVNGKINFSVSGDDIKNLIFDIDANFYDTFIFNRTIKNSIVKSHIREFGKITVDTIFVKFFNPPSEDDKWLIQDESEYIALNGFLDFLETTKLKYSILSSFESLNLAKIFKNTEFPKSLSGSLTLEGSGFELDSLESKLVLDMHQSIFRDRFLLPFSIDVTFNRKPDGIRIFQINSDFIDAHIEGKFSYSKLLPTLANQIDYLVDYVENKMYTVNPEFVSSKTNERIVEKVSEFPESNFQLNAEIKNLATFSFLLEDIDLFINSKVKLKYISDKYSSELAIEEIDINNLNVKSKDFFFNSNQLTLGGLFSFKISDSIASLQELDLKVSSNSNMIINSISFLHPYLNVKFQGDNAKLEFSTTMNDLFNYSARGDINFGQNEIKINFDTLAFAYDKLSWTSRDDVIAIYSDEGLTLKKFQFVRADAEKIEIFGTYRKEFFEDFNISVYDFPLNDINLLVSDNIKNSLPVLSGKINSIKVNLNGSTNEPIISMNLHTDGFELNSFKLGELKAILNHKEGVIKGEISIESNNRIKKDIAKINVVSLPLDLSFSSEGDGFHDREQIYIYCRIIDLPLELLQSFIPDLEELTGSAMGELTISGFPSHGIKYRGELQFQEASFILSANNLKYFANGLVRIETERIIIDRVELKNIPDDLKNGFGIISGYVTHKDFNPSYFDFKITSPRIMLLNDASVKSMPTLYGKFIIATGANPLRFWGTFAEPNLEGDVTILRADLKMPDELATRTTRSAMQYEIKERFFETHLTRGASTDGTIGISQNAPTKDFADLINYDLNIKFAGQFVLTMSISGSQLVAYVGTQDRNIPIRYVKLRDEPEPKLFGEINVKEGSMLKLYKVFSTSGNVYFPTGSVIDPGLDLIAEYSGKTYIGGSSRNYLVRLSLTGTKNRPNMSFSYFIDGVEQTGDSTTINENALFLLMTGKTKQQLFESGSAESDIFRETFTSLLSTETSKALTDLLSGTEVIQSADINFEGGDFQTARLKLTGRLFGDISWELGGTVADLANNNTFSIDVPLASLLNTNLLNMNVQVSTTTNFSTTNSIDQKNWEIKIKVGGNW